MISKHAMRRLLPPLTAPALLPLTLLLLLSLPASGQLTDCDESCLAEMARAYMAEIYRDNPSLQAARDTANDVVLRDFSRLPWADTVRFTENNVAMMIGEGFWGAARGRMRELLVLPDVSTGNVLWYGITEEHEQAAYHGMRLKVENRRIAEVETYFGREGTPDLFTATAGHELDPVFTQSVPESQRQSRQDLLASVNNYLETKELNDGTLLVDFSEDCARITNGTNVTHGNYWAADIARGCKAQLQQGLYKPVDRIRARRFPIVDEEKGLVVALSLEDHAARYVTYESTRGQSLTIDIEYPNTRGMLEIFKIIDGSIDRIEGVSVFLPYYIQSLWTD